MSKPAQPKSDQLISRRDLAIRWSTSIATVKRREHEGVLTRITFNRRLIRYRISDIERVEAMAMSR